LDQYRFYVKGEIPDALPKKKKTAVSHSCLIVFSRYIEMKLRQVVKQYSALSRRPMTLVGLSEDCEALFRLSKRPGSGDGKIGTDSGQIERLCKTGRSLLLNYSMHRLVLIIAALCGLRRPCSGG
jgi:hypothetical protein